MNSTIWITIGALTNALGVILGAFGAHFFKTRLVPEDVFTYETAVKYLFIHAIALVLVGLLAMRIESTAIKYAGWLFITGLFLFSGSLFLLIVTKIRAFGAVTPMGGLCFIAGWLALAFAAWRSRTVAWSRRS